MSKCATYGKKISVEQMLGTADAHGHIDPTAGGNWSEFTGGFARVQSKGGREFWKVDQVTADVSHVWTCPYNDTLNGATTDMRLVHDSDTYEILSVIDVNMAHEEIEIQTRRAV